MPQSGPVLFQHKDKQLQHTQQQKHHRIHTAHVLLNYLLNGNSTLAVILWFREIWPPHVSIYTTIYLAVGHPSQAWFAQLLKKDLQCYNDW